MTPASLFPSLSSWLLRIALALLLGAGPALADTPVPRYFRDLASLTADFRQTVYDPKGQPAQVSSGQVWMQKPGRFRWDYREPTRQLIVADGSRLWIYDEGLEQVTVRKLDAALGATPLALLSGAAPIDEAFKVGAARNRDGLTWTELTPKAEASDFRLLRVGFQGDRLAAIELEDAFGGRTRLVFEHLQRNAAIDAERFRFVPPKGVDVIGDVE